MSPSSKSSSSPSSQLISDQKKKIGLFMKRLTTSIKMRKDIGRYMKFRRSDHLQFDNTVEDPADLRGNYHVQEQETRSAFTKRLYRTKQIEAEYTMRLQRFPMHFEGGWDLKTVNPLDRQIYIEKLKKREDCNATIAKWGEISEGRHKYSEFRQPELRYKWKEDFKMEAKISSELAFTFTIDHDNRPCTHVTWLGPAYIAAAYADTQFGHEWWNQCGDFYLWHIERVEPFLTLISPSQAVTVECSDTRTDILLTGHLTGGLSLWDIRTGNTRVNYTPEYVSGYGVKDIIKQGGHEGFITTAQWTLHGGGNEIVSAGSEGVIKWWDIRHLKKGPIEEIVVSWKSNTSGSNSSFLNKSDPLSMYSDITGKREKHSKSRKERKESISSNPDEHDSVLPSRPTDPYWSTGLGATALEFNVEDERCYMVGTLNGHIMYGKRKLVENFSSVSSCEIDYNKLIDGAEDEEEDAEEEVEDTEDQKLENGENNEEEDVLMEKDNEAEEKESYLKGDRTGNLFIGAVRSLERSDQVPTIVLSCGDYKVKILHDKIPFSPIFSTPNQPSICTYATWNHANGACFHVTRENGYIDLWNMNCDTRKPVDVLQICNDRLLFARTRREGDLVAVCSMSGDLHLVRYSHAVYFTDIEEEALFEDLIEREYAREQRMVDRVTEPQNVEFNFRLKRSESNSEEDYLTESNIVSSTRDLSISESETNFSQIDDIETSIISSSSFQTEPSNISTDTKVEHIEKADIPHEKDKPAGATLGEKNITSEYEEDSEENTFAKEFWGDLYCPEIEIAGREFVKIKEEEEEHNANTEEDLYGITNRKTLPGDDETKPQDETTTTPPRLTTPKKVVEDHGHKLKTHKKSPLKL